MNRRSLTLAAGALALTLGACSQEPAAEADVDAEYLRIALSASATISLDEIESEGVSVVVGRRKDCDNDVMPNPIAPEHWDRQRIAGALLGRLSSRERQVLSLRFGLDNGEEHTLEGVGEAFGLTRERIRQIETQALAAMRRKSRHLRGQI